MANLNDNEYGKLPEFKKAFAKRFLIRVGNFEDVEPSDYNAEIEERLTDALRDASDQMDGFIAARYSVPVDPAPDYFEVDCFCIAAGMLVKRKGYEANTSDENFVTGGEKCLKKYEMIGKGQIDLPTTGDNGSGSPTSQVKACYPEKKFSQTTLDKY